MHRFKEEYLGTEWHVTRGDIMVQSINKHCGGSLRKQRSEVMDVFWKSPLRKTGQGALNKLKESSKKEKQCCFAWSFSSS